MKSKIKHWETLSDKKLLKIKLCDLSLELKGSQIDPQIQQLYMELAAKKLRFKPRIWLSTEWFSPHGVPGIAIPFYLIHPRLAELEKHFLGEVEGGTSSWLMQLLRHETGHAIDNAFRLRKSKKKAKSFRPIKPTLPERLRSKAIQQVICTPFR